MSDQETSAPVPEQVDTIIAFDRDKTVTTGDGPVPVGWVQALADMDNCAVWAIGNQLLCSEGEIPGFEEIRQWFDDDRLPMYPRRQRLRYLEEIHLTATTCIVVDDEDLSEVDGWRYYRPDEFATQFSPATVDKIV